MATAAFNDTIVQVHSRSNGNDETFFYDARWFDHQSRVKMVTFKYDNGNFTIVKGKTTERHTDFLIHCIQALELSNAFNRNYPLKEFNYEA